MPLVSSASVPGLPHFEYWETPSLYTIMDRNYVFDFWLMKTKEGEKDNIEGRES